MKKLVIIVVLLLGSAFAQSVGRGSASLPVISEPIAQIDEGIGWFFNASGQWVSYDRVISDEFFANFSDLVETAFGRSNLLDFQRIELREVQYNGQEYLGFFIHHTTGYYNYPNIRQDWREVNALVVCAFQPEQLLSLSSAISNTGIAERVAFDCTYGFSLSNRLTIGNLVEEAARLISIVSRGENVPVTLRQMERLLIDVFPVLYEGREFVRFLWESEFSSPYVNLPARRFDPLVFDSRYFEVDFASFNALTRR